MFILMTYLALNIPGNPDEITCDPIQGTGGLKIKSCITYIRSGTLYIPNAKVSLTCEGANYLSDSSATWTIYPKAGVARDGWGSTSICKVTEYKKLGAE